jgi:NADH:ubiquinone oxidoreductase subunit D
MHPAWFRIGGTAHDLPNNWQHLIREILDWMPKRLNEYYTAALKTLYLLVVPVMLLNTMRNLRWLGV